MLEAFETDGLRFKLLFWILDPDQGQQTALSEVNCAIFARVKSLGLRIPVPQREWTWSGPQPTLPTQARGVGKDSGA
jgi:small-conductance mechanosensitive channel